MYSKETVSFVEFTPVIQHGDLQTNTTRRMD